MTRHDDTRTQVTIQYAKAVSTEKKCGTDGKPARKGTLMKHAGYSDDELQGIPDDAVLNAFGCGNPLACASVEPGELDEFRRILAVFQARG